MHCMYLTVGTLHVWGLIDHQTSIIGPTIHLAATCSNLMLDFLSFQGSADLSSKYTRSMDNSGVTAHLSRFSLNGKIVRGKGFYMYSVGGSRCSTLASVKVNRAGVGGGANTESRDAGIR